MPGMLAVLHGGGAPAREVPSLDGRVARAGVQPAAVGRGGEALDGRAVLFLVWFVVCERSESEGGVVVVGVGGASSARVATRRKRRISGM